MNNLHIPELDLDQDVETLLASQEVVEKLEQCVMNWQTQITVILKEQEEKKPQVRSETCREITNKIHKITTYQIKHGIYYI